MACNQMGIDLITYAFIYFIYHSFIQSICKKGKKKAAFFGLILYSSIFVICNTYFSFKYEKWNLESYGVKEHCISHMLNSV